MQDSIVSPLVTSAYVDDPKIADTFSDHAAGIVTSNGAMFITLTSLRIDYSTSAVAVTRIPIGRLVMPFDSALVMAENILKVLEEYQAEQSEQHATDEADRPACALQQPSRQP